jgi:hypothetical protein
MNVHYYDFFNTKNRNANNKRRGAEEVYIFYRAEI